MGLLTSRFSLRCVLGTGRSSQYSGNSAVLAETVSAPGDPGLYCWLPVSCLVRLNVLLLETQLIFSLVITWGSRHIKQLSVLVCISRSSFLGASGTKCFESPGWPLNENGFLSNVTFSQIYSQSHFIWEKLTFCKSVLEFLKILITPAFTISLW